MTAPNHSMLFAALLVAACADPAAPPSAPESPSFVRHSPGKPGIVITDLGTLGGNESRVTGLNTPTTGRRILIVGQSQISSGTTLPAYWYVDAASGAKSVGLLSLPGGFDYRSGWGFDANSDEQIVGYGALYESGSYVGPRALLWSGPTAPPMLLAGLENTRAGAAAVNALGHATGQMATDTPEETAFFFDGTATTNLGSLGGPAEARDVNAHDVVVGISRTSTTAEQRAFVSSAGGPPIQLPDWGSRSSANAINDYGIIVGYALNAAGESRAVRWTGSISTGYIIQDLGLTNARAWDINSSGEIVGSFVGRRGERGFYQTAAGVTKELPILGYAGIAYAINENAHIVGISWFRGKYSHAVLWTAVR